MGFQISFGTICNKITVKWWGRNDGAKTSPTPSVSLPSLNSFSFEHQISLINQSSKTGNKSISDVLIAFSSSFYNIIVLWVHTHDGTMLPFSFSGEKCSKMMQ